MRHEALEPRSSPGQGITSWRGTVRETLRPRRATRWEHGPAGYCGAFCWIWRGQGVQRNSNPVKPEPKLVAT
jgi:hypothetical protein